MTNPEPNTPRPPWKLPPKTDALQTLAQISECIHSLKTQHQTNPNQPFFYRDIANLQNHVDRLTKHVTDNLRAK